ncbi:MAG: phosphohydrolase [endosymbiont of Galathealinum brachiosum]|uniref:Phosphohydrolase n=1 Tax=endosymbiont of Galathealinum brachiosum TaxID=2200906 RepID=A0A370DHM3_9GAMM|nr:MAG: phosphohydrolase [endosymbiont of Galathealinum brachiosum]
MRKNNNNNKLCIFHGNCPDGFGAAWAVRHALGDSVDFYKGVHQQTPPDVNGRDVFIVDFSYKKDVLVDMLTTAASITILDHHISAEKELAGLLSSGEVKGQFDMNKSGAMLAWEWFHPQTPAPKLIEHIQDRDLWQFKIDGTREVTTGLSSYPYDFDLWDKMMANESGELDALRSDGAAIERKLQKDIQDLIASGVRRMMIGGYNVPVLNVSTTYISDAGNIMALDEPFAACYWDHAGGRSFSLRSSEKGIDVSEIARQYGGGGHVKASGFTVESGWEGEL